MSASSPAFGRWSTAPPRARRVDGRGAARVAEHDHLGLGVLLEQRAERLLAGQRRVDQHDVVRVLADGGDRGGDARRPVHVGDGAVEQRAEVAAVGLVGGDEEEDEGRIGHGSNSDIRPVLKMEQ